MAAVMVVSISSFCGRVSRSLEWTDQGPRDGCASIAFPQRLGRLFSPAAKRRHSSRDKKAVCRRPPRCFGPDGCGPIAPRAKDRHRGCDWRGPTTEEDHHGYHRHFHRGGQRLRRIGQDAHAQFRAKFVPSEKDNDKAPDYRIIAGAIECGAAWKKTARDSDHKYLSVKLDDPSFPAPIYASLVKGEGDDSFNLIWSRRSDT
jgi:uncharacterized protein (DUF736 family)